MDLLEVLRINLLSPAVLAFVLGVIAVSVKSDLKIPEQVYGIISIYLLFAIGLKGGFDLAKSSLTEFGIAAIVAVIMGALIPLMSYVVLRRFVGLDRANAIALGIHYGAVSAVTLSASITFLDEVGETFEGFMPTMYVIMELPAVAVGLILASAKLGGDKRDVGAVIRAAFTGKSFLLLGGGVLIGFLSGDLGERQVGPLFIDLFSGILVLFLLEMGTLVGARLGELRTMGLPLFGFGVVMPLLFGTLAIALSALVGLSVGGAMIMGTLAASASYITAPTIVQTNIPDANPGLYLTSALVITFPFNIIIGLPIYYEVARFFVALLG